MMIVQAVVNPFGTKALAGYTAPMRVENVFSLIFVSIGNAVSPYVSQNLGAKKIDLSLIHIYDERLWRQINAALKKTFGLWLYNTNRIGDIRCLCPKCLNDYFRNPNYVVRRLDPFAKSKGTCDKCNDRGWDYIVYDKRTSFKGKGV